MVVKPIRFGQTTTFSTKVNNQLSISSSVDGEGEYASNTNLFFGLFFLNETLNNSDTLRGKEDIAPIWEAAISQQLGTPIDLPENYEETAYNWYPKSRWTINSQD